MINNSDNVFVLKKEMGTFFRDDFLQNQMIDPDPLIISTTENLIEDNLDLEIDDDRNDLDDGEIPMRLWLKIIFYIIYALICLLGIIGNVIVCYVVARKQSMHTVTNFFIANLALSDILLCLFAVPFTPLYLITFKSWIFGRALCHLVPFAQGKNR